MLVAAGYAGYLAVLLQSVTVLAMADRGGPVADYAGVLDAAQQNPSAAWVFLLFILGNLVGTLLLGVALWRSRSVPRWAAATIVAWPPLHVTGLVAGTEWFEVAGAVLQGIGFAAVGIRLLRSSRGPAHGRVA
jgi:hypothetical protein